MKQIHLILILAGVVTPWLGANLRADDDLLTLQLEAPSDLPGEPATVQENAIVWERGRFRSIQVNVSSFGNNIIGDAANEPSLAIDPTDPDIIVVGWRQFDTINSNFREAGRAYSHDRGQTWINPGVLDNNQFPRQTIELGPNNQSNPLGAVNRIQRAGTVIHGCSDQRQIPVALQPVQLAQPVFATSKRNRERMADRDAERFSIQRIVTLGTE